MMRRIWSIALPAIATNITVPLLGLIDTAITGHLGDESYIGAVGIGAMMFNMVYWLLGFLRMSTSGLTAQAYGAHHSEAIHTVRFQSLTIALVMGLSLVLLQLPLFQLLLWFYHPTTLVAQHTQTYFLILIWGAPAVLLTNSLSGWFLGMQDARSPMLTAVTQNIANILLSLTFVVGCGMKIEGVALGTLLAQYVGLGVALYRCKYRLRQTSLLENPTADFQQQTPILRILFRSQVNFFSVSRDIFLRTLCLVAVMSWFTRTGTRFGDTVLAANTVLMEFFLIASYVFDGIANAAEAIGGSLYGASDTNGLRLLIRRLFLLSVMIACAFTILYWGLGESFVRVLTDQDRVQQCAMTYLPYLIAVPLLSFTAFVLDGLFIGCTGTKAMLWSVGLSAVVFFLVLYLFAPQYANHALWAAYLLYLTLRGVILSLLTPRLLKSCAR